MDPRITLRAFDAFLAARGLRLEAVITGGAALNLLGVVTRPTRDCDVIQPELPAAVVQASRAFAAEMSAKGAPLEHDWLNNGPQSLVPLLPPDWQSRTTIAFAGRAIELRSLGRPELIATKIFALCDRAIDLRTALRSLPRTRS